MPNYLSKIEINCPQEKIETNQNECSTILCQQYYYMFAANVIIGCIANYFFSQGMTYCNKTVLIRLYILFDEIFTE